MNLNKRGFTLIEIIAVIGLLALLGTLTVPSIVNSISVAQNSTCVENRNALIRRYLQEFSYNNNLKFETFVDEHKHEYECPSNGNYIVKEVDGELTLECTKHNGASGGISDELQGGGVPTTPPTTKPETSPTPTPEPEPPVSCDAVNFTSKTVVIHGFEVTAYSSESYMCSIKGEENGIYGFNLSRGMVFYEGDSLYIMSESMYMNKNVTSIADIGMVFKINVNTLHTDDERESDGTWTDYTTLKDGDLYMNDSGLYVIKKITNKYITPEQHYASQFTKISN